jgi:glycosyltransferase involved in cell wall biosynthesis
MFAALKFLLKNFSYHVARFKSKAFEEKLIEILSNEKFDVIILETVYLSLYADIIRKYSAAKLILRAHNVEHTIWKRIAENASFGLKKLYLSILAKQLKTFEKSVISKYDSVWCISNQDAKWFKDQNNSVFITEVPFGIDIQKIPQKATEFYLNNLFSLGSMDWYPNREGIVWFLDNVWSEIHQKYPNLLFKIAGRNTPEHWKQLNYEGVEIIGEVENAIDFLLENGVLIVPLWSGSGVRIKIIEAMAVGKVVITTTIGLDGINAENKKHILVADTAEEFVNAVSFCLENPQKCQGIGENAQKFITENHNIDAVLCEI